MGLGVRYGQMVTSTKGTIKKAKKMGKDNIFGEMEVTIREIG